MVRLCVCVLSSVKSQRPVGIGTHTTIMHIYIHVHVEPVRLYALVSCVVCPHDVSVRLTRALQTQLHTHRAHSRDGPR